MTTTSLTFKLATAVAGLTLASGCASDDRADNESTAVSAVTASTYASGLNGPRGLKFGPDGNLYVAEAGYGGDQTATDTPECPAIVNVFSPYGGGYSGRVSRVLSDGTVETVADNLPSTLDVTGAGLGPTDVAFIGDTLYVLIEMGGCSHGLPDDLPAVLRVNPDGSTTNVANLNAWLAANPPHFIKDTDPTTSDFEPGGVFHSMIAVGPYLYVVETNRGMVVRVDPAQGSIERVFDMSSDNAEHNPIAITRRGNEYQVGTFGEDGGPAELAVFDRNFSGYTQPFAATNPIVGLEWHGNALYGVEMFTLDNPWAPETGNLVSFDRATGARTEVLTAFASYPQSLTKGPDGALYTSNWGLSFGPGDGGVIRVVP